MPSPVHMRRNIKQHKNPNARSCPGLLLCSTDMSIMYLCSKLQTGDRFLQMCLQRRDHDEHEGFRVTAKRILEEVSQLYFY